MKKIILQSVALFFVSLLLLTSCLGEGRNVESGSTVGVVRFDFKSARNVLDVSAVDAFYSSRFQMDNDGDCFSVDYEIDYDDPVNSPESIEANGYFTVKIFDRTSIPKGFINFLTDTSQAVTDELPLLSPVLNGESRYINGMFFIVSALQMPSDQKMDFHISYDMENMLTEEYVDRYYNVFMRATVFTAGRDSKENTAVRNAFPLKYLFEYIARKEKESGGKTFNLRFNYPSEISEDGQIKWQHQDLNYIPVDHILP